MSQSFLTLSELNLLVKGVIKESISKNFWLVAEISEIRENYSGHCYIEFIQKDEDNDNLIAKARANIWANTYRILKPYFETTTGNSLSQGMKILVSVSVEFHELYGYSLTILDIDPAYTLGDMEQKRALNIQKLIADGVFEMNRELEIPIVPQRIAIISSESAAGYGDFISQLKNNDYGFVFYPCLFRSYMQGEGAEVSILHSLDRIFENQQHFDVVVIIRGGGSRAELSCFDSYELASNICQFPLPVIAGIGHERDQSIIDMVANTQVKTPTAAAAFLIEKIIEFSSAVIEVSEDIVSKAESIIINNSHEIELLSNKLSYLASDFVQMKKENLVQLGYRFSYESSKRFSFLYNQLSETINNLKYNFQIHLSQNNHSVEKHEKDLMKSVIFFINKENQKINSTGRLIFHCQPDNILRKGFSMTLKNGKILKSSISVKPGDNLVTILSDGEIGSIVNDKF
jgi:exodeoxyribonuclease VII large subunit